MSAGDEAHPAVTVQLTQGNLNNDHVYLRGHLGFFPADAVGAAAERDGLGTLLTLHAHGLSESIETDIAGGNKLFFRKRAFWREFFLLHGLRAGDHVRIEKLSEYEYSIKPRSA